MLHFLRDLADKVLRLPEFRGFSGRDFDSTEAARLERSILARKAILHDLYDKYCQPFLESAARAPTGAVMLEIGAGTSPLKQRLPGVITSDVAQLDWLDLVCSAYALPFQSGSLDRIFLLFVCHHLGKIETFLNEAVRCLKPGGELVIVDPAITAFSRRYYTIHVDAMNIDAQTWSFSGDGRLSDSNIALAWIVFFRDRERFAILYPQLKLQSVRYNTCLCFLLSGGFRIRQLLPTPLLRALFRIENWVIRYVTKQLAVTMALTLRRESVAVGTALSGGPPHS